MNRMEVLRNYKMVAFLFELPFHIPIPENSTSTVLLDAYPIRGTENMEMFVAPDVTPLKTKGLCDFVSLKFFQVPKQNDSYPNLSASKKILTTIIKQTKNSEVDSIDKPKSFTTVVEAVSLLQLKKKSENSLTENFEKSLKQINNFIISYLSENYDNLVYPITKEDLPFACFYYSWKLNSRPKAKKVGIFLLHHLVDFEKEILNSEQFDDLIFRYTKMISDSSWDFGLELQVRARKSFERSDSQMSVILAQTSLEILINSILLGICWEENISKNDAYKKISELWFKQKIIEIGQKFNEDWDSKKNQAPTYIWNKKFYELRNKIIHMGYKPDYDEAFKALETAQKFNFYILETLSKNSYKYPKTAIRLAGVKLIKKLGYFTDNMESLANLAPGKLVPYKLNIDNKK